MKRQEIRIDNKLSVRYTLICNQSSVNSIERRTIMERMNNSLEGFGAVVTGNGLSEFRLWTE